MRIILLPVTLLFVICLCGQSVGAADLAEGFMKAPWNSHVSRHEGLVHLYLKQGVTYYANPGEVLTLRSRPVPNVVYGFYNDRFFAVYIGIDTLEDFADIKRYMQEKYGIPVTDSSTKTGETVYKWKYKKTKIKLKIRKKTEKMKLAFYYRPISKQLNESQLEEFHETSFRWFPVDKDKTPKMIPLLEF